MANNVNDGAIETYNTAASTKDVMSLNADNSNIINTFGNNPEDVKIVFNATSNSDSLNDHMGEVITLKGVFMTNGTRRGYDGQADTPCVNTYIVDVDNKSYFTQSKGIARDMNNLLTLYRGNVEGVQITIGERELPDKRKIKFIELV